MREIKFRAWNGERIINRTLFDRNWYSEDDKCVMVATPRDARILKVMQFTGLKDINGVEIYEGDIVNHNGIGIGFVEYKERQAAFKIIFSGTTRKWFVDMLDREYGLLEVIGNIYENPELITK